jgi:hypothetical protein
MWSSWYDDDFKTMASSSSKHFTQPESNLMTAYASAQQDSPCAKPNLILKH